MHLYSNNRKIHNNKVHFYQGLLLTTLIITTETWGHLRTALMPTTWNTHSKSYGVKYATASNN